MNTQTSRLRASTRGLIALALLLSVLLPVATTAAPTASPLAGPCAPGASYDQACDVDHDGDVDVIDIQLSAGHWNQSGTFNPSDNNHDHLGQTWTGNDNPLTIQGSFATADANAPLTLNNSGGVGLRVDEAGGHGVRVGSAGNDGLRVLEALNDGVQIDAAGKYGVNVRSAAEDGVFVCATGSNSGCTPSGYNNGMEIGNAEDFGVWVTSADYDGVRVYSAGLTGVYVGSAGIDGMYVDSAGGSGVKVGSVGSNGMVVGSAGGDGVQVGSASSNGVWVGSAGDDGFVVWCAGNVADCTADTTNANGFEVAKAEDYGAKVVYAGRAAFRSDGSGTNAFYAYDAGDSGVWIRDANNWAGYFTGDINVTGNCTGCLIAQMAVNNGDDNLQPGDIVAMDGIADSPFDGLDMLMRVRRATSGSALIGVVSGRAEPFTSSEDGTNTLVPRNGEAAALGDYLSVVIYGPVQVEAASDVAIGQRVTVDDAGLRAMRRVEVDGVTLDEGGSSLGVALDAAKDGMVWVLVNPQ